MLLPLRARLLLLGALVLAAALLAFGLITDRAERRRALEGHVRMLERLGRLAAGALEAAPPAPAALEATARRIAHEVGARVTLIAGDGRVLADSDVPEARIPALENHGSRPEVREALAGRAGRALRRSATLGIDLQYVAVPARAAPIAVVRLAERPTLLDAEVSTERLLPAALVVLLAGVGLVAWGLGPDLRRIRQLERTAERLAEGDAAARANETPGDEIGRLGRAVNRLAAERRARLDALARERDERERMLQHLSDGVALIDGEGRLVRSNASLAEMFGAARPAGTDAALGSFVRAPELDELAAHAREAGRPVELEVRLWAPRPRVVHAVAIPLGAASPGSVLLVVRDLTEIERLNRVRQDFVANVSHELRTPLTSLRGYAETLLDGALDDVEHREGFVRSIRDGAVRLEALLEDLLSLAELERPGVEPRVSAFDLRAAAAAQVEAFRLRAERAGLGLVLEPGAATPVRADRARMDQVMANLIDNAVKYTERGGVRVRVGGDAAAAWLEVEDTGPGIPEDERSRVFERFYRVDKARSREKGGTGLGLSIVKHIVALHGGEVTLDSELGRGSVFRVRLPQAPGLPNPPA